jgi:hypothetical protein
MAAPGSLGSQGTQGRHGICGLRDTDALGAAVWLSICRESREDLRRNVAAVSAEVRADDFWICTRGLFNGGTIDRSRYPRVPMSIQALIK